MMSDDKASPVVAGVDGTKKALTAARWAATVADKFAAPLHIVYAVPDTFYYLSGLPDADRPAALARMRESTEAILKDAEQAVRADYPALRVAATAAVQPPGKTAREALVHLSRQARLFVVGCDEVGPAGALLVSSETLALAGHSACPVVAWRGDIVMPDDRPILVGVEGTDNGTDIAALATAFEFAHRFEVPLLAVHAWSTRRQPGDVTIPFLIDWDEIKHEDEASLLGTLAPWRRNYPSVDVTMIVSASRPSRLLIQHAGDAQLVVVGRSRRGHFASLVMGSTNLNLLHHSPVGVAICPAPPHQNPTTGDS
jgi:nucleotide-binding universal stress UspA family protein